MTAKECLQILRDIKDVAFATVDEKGMPHARMIDVMLVEEKKLYFCTARGKNFYRQLENLPRTEITGMNREYQMVRLSGKVKRLADQKKWIDRIFRENPSMNDVYPGESRYILEPFCIEEGQVEFFDLGKSPIYRESFAIGMAEKPEKGFEITDACIGCGKCKRICPQQCIAEGAPFVMGAPNLCVDIPAMWEFSKKMNVPIAGKDFKSGQTLMKTVLAPMFKTRMLGVSGWFSTNILGNRDGEVLDQPENFKTKEVSKLSVIDNIFEPEKFPDLYGNVYHKVRINYYPPRKDNKEAWDNIDIFGWMGYPMEIKVNFLCRDTIGAAPIALDLVLFSDLAMRAGWIGIQTWLSFFCKSPMHDFEHQPVHDLFQQWRMVKQALRAMIGEKEPDYLD